MEYQILILALIKLLSRGKLFGVVDIDLDYINGTKKCPAVYCSNTNEAFSGLITYCKEISRTRMVNIDGILSDLGQCRTSVEFGNKVLYFPALNSAYFNQDDIKMLTDFKNSIK